MFCWQPIAAAVFSIAASFGFGWLWYMLIFKDVYMAEIGAGEEGGQEMATKTAIHIAGLFVTAMVVSWMIRKDGIRTVIGGLKFGLIHWVAFVAAIIGPLYAYQGKSKELYGIDAGYHLIVLLLMGVVFAKAMKYAK